jgi:hypothetical protein
MSETVHIEKLQLQDDGNWAWVPTPVAVDTDGDFAIDELNLNKEICRMGQLLLKYGDLAAEFSAELERKKEELKFHHARLAGAERSSAEKAGTKTTEGKLQELVTIDPTYQQHLANLHRLRADALKVDHWWRTANTKAKMLEALAFRQSAEIRRGNH